MTKTWMRILAASLVAVLLYVAMALPAEARRGQLITNTETGDSVWIPSSWLWGMDDEGWAVGGPAVRCEGYTDTGVFGHCTNETVDSSDVPEGTRFFNEQTGTLTDEDTGEYRSVALGLFDYAMGGSCISCDFMAYFMSGITNFSESVYAYFLGAFKSLIPLGIAIWLGYRVAKLLSVGGEDGKSFLYSVVQKLALFAMIFMIFETTVTESQGEGTNRPSQYFAWNMIGPNFAGFAFDIAGDLRNSAMTAGERATGVAAPITAGGAPYNCGSIEPASGSAAMIAKFDYIKSGLEVTCVTERTHMIGIATGLAVMFSSWTSGDSFLSLDIGAVFVKAMLTGIVKILTGALLLAIYCMSAVWLIFLTLDIVTRIMITAAFAPVLGGLYMWQPTRGMATNAIKAQFGTIMTAVALSIISIIALFLMSNTIQVYEALRPTVAPAYANENYIIEPIDCSYATSGQASPCYDSSDRINQLRQFVIRTQQTDNERARIPMDLGTPWLYYLILSGIAIFAVGKKIVRMLEDLMGYQGISAFADNATQRFKHGVMMGGGAAVASIWTTKVIATKTPAMGGAISGGARALYNNGVRSSVGSAAQAIKSRFGANPFANPEQAAGKSVLSRLGEVNAASRTAQGVVDAADEQ